MGKGALPAPAKAMQAKVADRRQPQLLMPLRGGNGAKKPAAPSKPGPVTAPAHRRKRFRIAHRNERIVALAMANKPSVDFCGYWQRSRAAPHQSFR
jgi:hypothetical protein